MYADCSRHTTYSLPRLSPGGLVPLLRRCRLPGPYAARRPVGRVCRMWRALPVHRLRRQRRARERRRLASMLFTLAATSPAGYSCTDGRTCGHSSELPTPCRRPAHPARRVIRLISQPGVQALNGVGAPFDGGATAGRHQRGKAAERPPKRPVPLEGTILPELSVLSEPKRDDVTALHRRCTRVNTHHANAQ